MLLGVYGVEQCCAEHASLVDVAVFDISLRRTLQVCMDLDLEVPDELETGEVLCRG